MKNETRQLLHSAFERTHAENSLEQTPLSDQQRIAVVFQAAALLAHLECGGWYLPDGWDGALLSPSGLLKFRTLPQAGQAIDFPQVSLRRLLERLFQTQGAIEGRGEARRAARHLRQRWLHALAPIPANTTVEDILATAPFLWQTAFGNARAALVGEHVHGMIRTLWIIAPEHVRRRLLNETQDRQQAEERLRQNDARFLWQNDDETRDPEALFVSGRYDRALSAWNRLDPDDQIHVLPKARCLLALGRYSQTLEMIKGRSSRDARILRAWCRFHLGEYGAARKAVHRLREVSLSPRQLLDATDLAVRLAGLRGQIEDGLEWSRRAVTQCRGHGPFEAAALLLAAESASDRSDISTMDRYLGEASDAKKDPEWSWRWHRVRALRSLTAQDGQGVVDHLRRALGTRRRQLGRAEAARLWNDLAVGYSLNDQLPAAERACIHTLRLLHRCEGPSVRTLALYNLAEVRIRRGRFEGAETVLNAVTAENRRSGNLRGLVYDLELWVRLELSQGRLLAALARQAEVRQRYDEHLGTRRGFFNVLAARAYGWLGRRTEAQNFLKRTIPENSGSAAGRLDHPANELEPEERPALWAHAGDWDRALKFTAGSQWERLWVHLAAEQFPPSDTWNAVQHLEPFRAARLVFDCELLRPGVVPPAQVRQAIATLHHSGAAALAEKLENRSLSPWHALGHYLERPTRQPKDAADLLERTGYGDAELRWCGPHDQQILVSGCGGTHELTAPFLRGELVLRAPVVDQTLKTLFSLIQRDLKLPASAPALKPNTNTRRGIVGESKPLLAALERLDQLSRGSLPILILGESGTGKELFAKRVHQQSPRQNRPFLVVNCAALSESLILSDLFGHARGAFTGADREHQGVFESAQSGTLFLDEIGDLPTSAQGKLLRVLQEGEIRRLGETFPRKVDVRVVAATHRDLEQMVREDQFRQDLFFRLKVATIKVPPLRDRGEDILRLAEYFVQQKINRSPVLQIADTAKAQLLSYLWPGNIRELRNVLEVAAALCSEDLIQPEHLDLPTATNEAKGQYHRQVKAYRKKLIVDALSKTQDNRSAAARRLGLTRQALSYLIRELDIF